jgi:glycosyltransferase involved in cell wall biosynthesis
MSRSGLRIVDVINLSSSADTLLRERVLSLRAKGVDSRIVCIDGPYVSSLRRSGIPVHTVNLPRGLDPFRLAWSLVQMVAIFRRVKPDLVHTHCSVPGIVGRVAARLAGVPVVMHTVHGFAFHEGSRGPGAAFAIAVERFVGRLTDQLLSQNHEDIDRAIRHRIVPKSRVEWVGNGIALDRFTAAAADDRAAAPAREPGRPVVITCVARMEPVKNHTLLFEAAVLLRQRGHRFVLWLVGGGEGRARCERQVAELGLAGHVRFLGYRNDIPDVLGQSDVGVLTSLKEGIPRAAIEAMAAGLPMVATRVTGTREVVRDGETGFLVDVGEPAALANALARLIDDPALRERMGARGREVARAEFDEALIVRRLERVYRASLERRGIGVPAALAGEVHA